MEEKTAGELRRAMGAGKPTGRVEEHERGVEPGGIGAVIRKIPKSLKLSWRGSVERQAQHRPDWLSKPRTGLVRPDLCVNRVRRPVRNKGRIGAETGRPSHRYSARNIFWELV